ncbi:hypothetical protein GCM10020220_025940 [Nonomuraea rubra]|uniref:MFS transporter n=1 Tax=Nonomuraea rubra TaxID=46180 RepID=UPI0031F06C8F
MRRARRVVLGTGGAVVLLAALDAYVVVTVLIDIAGDVGIPLNHLERATPIVTGFLLGYVAAMPLLGQLSDRYGRRPLIHACLAAFALGSVLTALAAGEVMVVAGRTVQGVAGGALLPITMALIGDLWEERERPVALGAVGAAQELGSALGPLYGGLLAGVPGAVVAGVELGGWHAIFWINVPLAALAAVAIHFTVPPRPLAPASTREQVPSPGADPDAASGTVTASHQDPGPAGAATAGEPATATSAGPAAHTLAPETAADTPDAHTPTPESAAGAAGRVDVVGGALLALALGLLVVGLYNPDPATAVLPPWGPPVIAAGVLVAGAFVWWEIRSPVRLLDLTTTRKGPLLATLGVSFLAGAALLVTMVFVQITAQTLLGKEALAASLVLARFLAALTVAALLGRAAGAQAGRPGRGGGGHGAGGRGLLADEPLAARPGRGGLVMDRDLVLAGLGLGLVIAPVSSAVLRVSTCGARLRVAIGARSSMPRMMGMLIAAHRGRVGAVWGSHSVAREDRWHVPTSVSHAASPLPFVRGDQERGA